MTKKRKFLIGILTVVSSVMATFAFTGCSAGDKMKTKWEQLTCKHKYGEYVETVAPTCSEYGEKEKTCSECGKVKTDKVEKVAHIPVSSENKLPTCTEDGFADDGKVCEMCEKVLTAPSVLPATGHKKVVDKGVDATCSTDGLTEGSHCGDCGEILKAQEVIPMLRHSVVTLPAVEPTCQETGLTEGVKCTRCDTVYVEQEIVDKVSHLYENNECVYCSKFDYSVFENSENYTEEKLEIGDKIAGQWLRLYNPNTNSPSGFGFTIENVLISDEVALSNNVSSSYFLEDIFAFYRRYATDYFVDNGVFQFDLPFEVYEGDDYIDIRFVVGTYKFTFEGVNNIEIDITFEITEDSVVTFIKNIANETTDLPFYKLSLKD